MREQKINKCLDEESGLNDQHSIDTPCMHTGLLAETLHRIEGVYIECKQ